MKVESEHNLIRSMLCGATVSNLIHHISNEGDYLELIVIKLSNGIEQNSTIVISPDGKKLNLQLLKSEWVTK